MHSVAHLLSQNKVKDHFLMIKIFESCFLWFLPLNKNKETFFRDKIFFPIFVSKQ